MFCRSASAIASLRNSGEYALDISKKRRPAPGTQANRSSFGPAAALLPVRLMSRGYNEEKGFFTQHYDTTEVDASLLLLPSVGFIPADDPRFLGTVRAVEKELVRDGHVLRYRTDAGLDGLPGGEHPFLACSFWLVNAYALIGRLEDGHALMSRLVALANDVGLLSEEYDPAEERMIGNFPQAFSHLALIGAANTLQAAEKALSEAAASERTAY